MARPAIQLYSLREAEEPLPAILDSVADAGFAGVEFAFRVTDANADAVAETLRDRRLAAVGAHVPVDRLEGDPEGVAAFYRELGCETLVVPSLDEEYFRTESDVRRAADRLERLADELPNGVDLLYHNHRFEFADLDGPTAYEVLVDATDDRVGFELDVGHAALAGADPIDLLHRFGHRTPLIHVRDADFEAGEWVPLGDGDVDLAGIGMAAREPGRPGVDWAIFEDETGPSLAGVGDAAETIRGLMSREGDEE